MRQAGMQAETSSWVFLVSACIAKRRRGSLLQRLAVVEWRNSQRPSVPESIPGPTRRLRDGLSLSHFADQGSNPTKHNPPPPPPTPTLKKVVPKYGRVEGSKSKNSLGDHFVSQNTDFTRG